MESDLVVLVGCGSIGLPFAVALAKTGLAVDAYDVDAARMAALANGSEIPVEAALAEALAAVMSRGLLKFTYRLEKSTKRRAFVLAVQTPWTAEAGFDDSYLVAAIDSIASVMRDGDLLLIRSTTPVGTTRALAGRVAATGLKVDVAAVPDRTVEGQSFTEQFNTPHLVGGVTHEATGRATAILERLGKAVPVRDPESAEAAKLFSNAIRHALFSLSNEMALICETLGLDFHHVLRAASENYPRFKVPRPGPVGGPCLNKDIGMLTGLLSPVAAPIFNAARSMNGKILDSLVAAVENIVPPNGRVAILGIAFKGNPPVDDARGSFALEIANRLRALIPSITLAAWDPVMSAESIVGLGLEAAGCPVDAAEGASVVIISNDHPALTRIDQAAIGDTCRKPALIYNLSGSTFPAGPGFGPGVEVRTFGVAG